jgi:hypothetical protein
MDEPDRLLAVAALGRPAEALDAWRRWRETVAQEDASALLVWAGGYIGRNLRQEGVHDPYLAGIARYNFLANNRRLIGALPTIKLLTSRFAVSPMKSFGLSESTSARSVRPLADFDFFVPFTQERDVRRTLSAAGYRPNLDVDDREFERRVLPHRSSWNFLDDHGNDLDLHWRLFDHLDVRANARLVERHSRHDDSEFGAIERLRPELMALLLATHHIQDPSTPARLFDLAHLIATADPGVLVRLAGEADLRRELADATAALRALIGDLDHPGLAELERRQPGRGPRPPYAATRIVPPSFDLVPRRYAEPHYWRRSLGARVWRALGRPAWLERRLVARGPLSAPDAEPRADDDFPLGGGRLGPGWLHRYPFDRFRWASIPDTRIVFGVAPGASRLSIAFDAYHWPRSPYSRIRVRVDGHPVGICDRSASTFEFPLPPHGPVVEVSLRPAGYRRFVDPGIHVRWSRLLAPIASIAID